MEKIKLNHWYVRNNELSISLMDYYVRIQILSNDNMIVNNLVNLVIYSKDLDEYHFKFETLEDAITFVENVVSCNKDIDKIMEIYNEKFPQRNIKIYQKII